MKSLHFIHTCSLLLICLFFSNILVAQKAVIDSLTKKINQIESSDTLKKTQLLLDLSWAYHRQSADSTVFYAKAAFQSAQLENDKKSQAAALKNIGIGYDIQGQTDSALFYMEGALGVAKELEDKSLITRNLNNLGLAHHRQGHYEVALDYYYRSLDISRKISDPLEGTTLMNIGLLEQKLENYDAALLNYQQALAKAKEFNKVNRIARCLYNIGAVYINIDDCESAEKKFKETLDFARQNEDTLLKGKATNSLARVFKERGQTEKARELLLIGLELSKESKDNQTQVQALNDLALIDYYEGNYKQSISYSERGLGIARKSKSRENLQSLLNILADSHAAMGDFEKAYPLQEEYANVSSELFNKEKARKIRAIQISENIKQKETEVALLKFQKSENEITIQQQRQKISIYLLVLLLALCVVGFFYFINKNQKSQNAELEKKVRERTLDLELLNKELKNSNEELERFAFITSHDLKEPLRNISGFTSLLDRKIGKKLDGEGKTYIQFVKKNTQQMHKLIEDVLNYSRINKNKAGVEKTNLNEIVEGVKRSLSELSSEKNGIILSDHLPIIEAIPSDMATVFENIIENGLKFNKSETPKVQIRSKREGNFLVFSFQDNGIGIDVEYHELVFKMFKRLHNRADYLGSGLGLALVKKLMERCQGEVWLDSEPNLGTTVYLKIPLQIKSVQSQIKAPESRDLVS